MMREYKRYDEYKSVKVDWIDEIPKHWDKMKISHYFKIGRGRVISKGEIADNKGEYPVYSSQTENNGVLGFLNSYDFEGDYITWTTDGANAGTVFRRKGKFNCTNV
jgi:type I restriction enzyme S subunit